MILAQAMFLNRMEGSEEGVGTGNSPSELME